MITMLLAGAGLFAGKAMGKSSAEGEAKEKLELLKKLAELTPDQASAVDAVAKMPVEEARERVRLGVGPHGPLPSTASSTAQLVQAAKAEGVKVTPEEKAAVAMSADKNAAIQQLVDLKVATQAPPTMQGWGW